MRLPGTVNVLSPDKRKSGRTPKFATVDTETSAKSDKYRHTVDQLRLWAPPVPHWPGKAGKGNLPRIDMEAVTEVQAAGSLPSELASRFDAALSWHGHLKRLWDGETTPGDGSPSTCEFELVGWLKRFGTFDPTDCAKIICLWSRQSVKHADDLERR